MLRAGTPRARFLSGDRCAFGKRAGPGQSHCIPSLLNVLRRAFFGGEERFISGRKGEGSTPNNLGPASKAQGYDSTIRARDHKIAPCDSQTAGANNGYPRSPRRR